MKIKGGIDTIMDDERTKFAELEKLIAEHKDQKGALMPVLQGAQAIFGCVSEDVQKAIPADTLLCLGMVANKNSAQYKYSIEMFRAMAK